MIWFTGGSSGVAFEVMQQELEAGGKSTGLMSLRQTEYFDGDEKHLQFLEGYPEVSIVPCLLSLIGFIVTFTGH